MPTKPSDVLETFDNPHPHRDYIIAIEIPEFTCLCPRTGQPDFATLFLQYVPDRHCVELKSLKLYIWSYRDEGAFHEDVSNQILNDLVSALKPRYMRLRARFNVRGGITTSVIVEHYKPGWTAPPPPPEWLLSWPDADISAGGVDRDTGAAETTSAPASSNAAGPTPALGGTDDAMTTAIPDDTVYVGIDLEITGCQAVAIDNEGAVLGRAEALIPAPLRNQEQVTQDPTQWWKAVSASLTTLFTAVKPDRVKAIAVDGTSGTVLLCDETGRPVTPALMYDDARALAQAQAIGKYAGPNCGAHEPTSSLAKLLWLQEKKMHSKARWLLHQADWVAGRLSGLWGQSDYNNCLKLGFDPEAVQWPPWLADLGIDARLLPSVHSPGETLGCITAEAARVFGLKPDTRIVAGTTDGVAAFLAAGAQAPGQGVTFLRTSLSLKLVSDKPVFSPEYGVSSHRLGDCWLAGGRSNSGGGVLLQYFDTAQMQAMTSQLNPEQATSLDYYPLPRVGERFPVNDPKLPPRLEPLPADSLTFFQGMLEGMAKIEAQGYALLCKLGAPKMTKVLTTGTGSENPAWQRIRERILGVPVRKARSSTAAYGTALLAAGIVEKTYASSERTGTTG